MSRIEALTLERDDKVGVIVLDAARPWRRGRDERAPPASDPASLDSGSIGPGSVWFVGWRAQPAPAPLAADIVVHDPGLEAAAGALSPGCYREIAAGEPQAASERLKKLAGEGWRVVRLVAGDPATMPRAAAELGLLAGSGLYVGTFPDAAAACGWAGRSVVAAAIAFAGPAPRPQLFAAGCDGLAG